MKTIYALLLAMLLTSCTGLSILQTSAVNHIIDRIPEREVNSSLTADERLEEGGELPDEPVF